jgi:hypothetical protein
LRIRPDSVEAQSIGLEGMMQPLFVPLEPKLPDPEAWVAIEVQLREPVLVKFQQALQRYGHHNADSLFAEVINHYLSLLTILEAPEQQQQFQGLIHLLETCGLSLLQNHARYPSNEVNLPGLSSATGDRPGRTKPN